MIYVISDIHGEYGKLKSLLNILNKDVSEYVFLGDYSDKGIQVKEVVDCLSDLSRRTKCIFLMGDHEYAWLQYFNDKERFIEFLLDKGGITTLESYLGKPLTRQESKEILEQKQKAKKILSKFIEFCLSLKIYYELNFDFLCVHAGINPDNRDLVLDAHSQEETVFIRDKFIKSKFLYRERKIIFGHTSRKIPYVDNYKIGIDTGAVYKEPGFGLLTAYNVTKNEFVNHTGQIVKVLCRSENYG